MYYHSQACYPTLLYCALLYQQISMSSKGVVQPPSSSMIEGHTSTLEFTWHTSGLSTDGINLLIEGHAARLSTVALN